MEAHEHGAIYFVEGGKAHGVARVHEGLHRRLCDLDRGVLHHLLGSSGSAHGVGGRECHLIARAKNVVGAVILRVGGVGECMAFVIDDGGYRGVGEALGRINVKEMGRATYGSGKQAIGE